MYNKGYVVPDQDLEDLQHELERAKEVDLGAISNYSKTIFQCSECSRLILDLNGEYHTFFADDPDKSTYALRSVFGEKWKRHLRGNWHSSRGSLWWGSGVTDQGFDFEIENWADLSKRYFEAFERLKDSEILRDSFLRRDGVMVHEWSPP